MSRRPPLTLRLLRAMWRSCDLHAAGGPRDLTGYDDAASETLHSDVCDAAEWLRVEIQRREAKSKRPQPSDENEDETP